MTTVSDYSLWRRAESWHDVLDLAKRNPFKALERYQIKEIREAAYQEILKPICRRWDLDPSSAADWFEERIRVGFHYHNTDERLCQAYLFMPRKYGVHDDLSLRAIDFLIEAVIDKDRFRERLMISKLIFGFLDDHHRFYRRSVHLRKFIELLLDPIVPDEHGRAYSPTEWHGAARAIRQMVSVHDVSFLPLIERALKGHEMRIVGFGMDPGNYGCPCVDRAASWLDNELGAGDWLEGHMNTMFLRRAVEYLKNVH